MSRFKHATPKLPAELLDRLGPSNQHGGKRKGKMGAPLGRKEKRQAERAEKKSQRSQSRSYPPGGKPRPQNLNPPLETEREPAPPPKRRKIEPSAFPDPAPKSILKKKSQKLEVTSQELDSSPSPPPQLTRKSRAVKDKLDEDDAEIAALEKRLGLKGKKKLPKLLEEDGLDDILEGLGDESDGGSQKRKRSEYEEYLSSKRRNVGAEALDSDMDDNDAEEEFDVESDEDELLDDDDVGSEYSTEVEGNEDDEELEKDEDDKDIDDPFGRSDSDQSQDEEPKRVRENPYLPGFSTRIAPTPTVAKYVPPSMRGPQSSDQEILTRLRRQLQNPLNRLSEANFLTILRDVENVFNSNPRQYVTSILIDLLMERVCVRTTLTDTFMILHAGFISAVYKVIGPHFGAQILERIVTEFDRYYDIERASGDGNKQASNLVAFLADMYTFQVFGSRLAFDYIRLLLDSKLSGLNTELLLKIIKNCGHQLRVDDPSALKEIVILLQKQVKIATDENRPISVRTQFMIETINNLKNNRQKTGQVNANIAAEHTITMKKTLGTLTKSSEPLGVGLEDVRGTKKAGKWWLVGASWKNDTAAKDNEEAETMQETVPIAAANEDEVNELTDLTLLAKHQGMNTTIRRSVFLSIMSASDYKDAHQRLIKLKLRKTQELEIPRVLIRCAGSEQVYNPYYTLIARRLCGEHKYKWAFQYGLWSLFRQMGEKGDIEGEEEDSEEDGDVNLRMLVNLGRMYGELTGEGALAITVLKTLDFTSLQGKTKSFLEIMLLTILKTAMKLSKKDKKTDSTASISSIFAKAKKEPQIIVGLQYFLTKELDIVNFVETSSEKRSLKSGLKIAQATLALLASELPAVDA
ncbi:Imidazole glycerol phosphate synthase [Venturia nashicola]|uniref:Imidazole glycerol phosphate synthase n=1 Tax=Venturia nashicola TaxID=86259 RepID=A0A4Z1PGM3_9PEZI|nr:Imidazole glycerol phosphate synthase [Venturia nashicola]